ncbi:MAG: PQQ-binding-like beta-propeller repeat protein [Verrucomicrobiae bacterium]|nr:PQQ-binding-like beta-propeller repeat protein [Verrucomicrobiae bacterium]
MPLRADDWTHWRGPTRNGISAESGWSDRWPDDGPRVAWKARVGLGFSSFVVGEGRAYTMGHAEEQDTIFCLDAATGRELWRHAYPAALGDKFFDGGTTGTPTLDAGRLFTLSRWGDVFCLDAATGTVLWTLQVVTETGARIPDWGFGGAPLVLGERVYLNVGDGGLALERETGAVAWRSGTRSAGYSTPLPVGRGSETLGLFSTGQSYLAVRLRDGSPTWSLRWLTEYGVNAADPIVDGDHLFLSSGYGKGAALYRLGPGEPVQVWKSKVLRTQMNAAVLLGGHLYGVDGDTTEKAALKCVEAATGAELWSQGGFGSGGLIIAGGRILALGGTGELMVAPATPDGFEPVSRSQVLGGKTWTAPVLANGRVYCRNSRGDVVCLDLQAR